MDGDHQDTFYNGSAADLIWGCLLLRFKTLKKRDCLFGSFVLVNLKNGSYFVQDCGALKKPRTGTCLLLGFMPKRDLRYVGIIKTRSIISLKSKTC